MIMKRFYFMLAILPMLVACSTNNEDEPILIIDPVEPITKATTIKDMLMNAGATRTGGKDDHSCFGADVPQSPDEASLYVG